MIRHGLIFVRALALASCAANANGEDGASGGDDSGSGSGGAFPGSCSVALNISPLVPAAQPGARVTVTATFNDIPGAFTPTWTVTHAGVAVAITDGGDGHSVSFPASDPGIYDIAIALVGAPTECASATRALNVINPQGALETLRLRVLAPQRFATPPLEVYVQLQGGTPAQDTGVVVVPSGQSTLLRVLDTSNNAGVPAYVQLSPAGTPDAIIEAFTDGTGAATVATSGGLYNVLVVPSDGVSAPRRIASWTSSVIGVTAGQTVTGSVLGPDSAPLAGARVQVTVDGTPSTVATTAADGSFALHVDPRALGAQVAIDVAPLAASGLPRLSASSTSFALGAPFQITYAKNVTTRDLAGVVIRRAGAGVAGAQVTVVGQVGGVGSVTAGGTVTATGSVALTATADGTGAPAMKVPAAALAAVIAPQPASDPSDVAVAALDTTTSAPASLDAPAMALIATAITDGSKAGLGGAVLDLVPTGALAAASASPIHAVANAAGAITARIATGGHYDLRLRDPGGAGGPVVVADRTIATIPTSLALGAALAVRGQVLYAGHTALAGASIQLLCDDCTGLERTRPIAEGQTDAAGRFVLTVLDPGLR